MERCSKQIFYSCHVSYMLYLRLFLLMNGTWIATLLLFEISPEHSYRQGAFKLIHSSRETSFFRNREICTRKTKTKPYFSFRYFIYTFRAKTKRHWTSEKQVCLWISLFDGLEYKNWWSFLDGIMAQTGCQENQQQQQTQVLRKLTNANTKNIGLTNPKKKTLRTNKWWHFELLRIFHV